MKIVLLCKLPFVEERETILKESTSLVNVWKIVVGEKM